MYEATRVDGASAWQRTWRITLPLVTPALAGAVLFRVLDALRMYDLPAILTHGANGTTTMSVFAYRQAINQGKFGYGSALSTGAPAAGREPAVRSRRRRRRPWRALGLAPPIAIVLVHCLFPFYWMLVSSLRAPNDIFDNNLLPVHASLQSFRALFGSQNSFAYDHEHQAAPRGVHRVRACW